MKKTTKLRNLISSKELEFIMEAHDGVSSKIVEEAGFQGIWASGLSMSASLGVRDNNELSFKEVADHCYYMASRVDIPVLLDMDTGYGDFNTATTALRHLEAAGIAGVVIEDKKFPKTNSFLNNAVDALADPKEFALKIKAMKDTQSDPDFVVAARVEAYLVGLGTDEAIKRARLYAEHGADAILVHSKKPDSSEIDDFMRNWDMDVPVIIVPTKYYSTPSDHFREIGISLVIWANHNLRSAVAAMQATTKAIFESESLIPVEDKIVPVKEIFRIQGNADLEEREKIYAPKNGSKTNAIILAASRGSKLEDLTQDKPKTMIKVNGKPILAQQLEAYNANGVSNITTVLGYMSEAVPYEVNKIINKNYQNTSEADSLALAKELISPEGTIISYGDLLFKRYIIADLLNSEEEFGIVVSSEVPNGYNEYVYATASCSQKSYGKVPYGIKLVNDLTEEETSANGTFVGIMMVKGSAAEKMREILSGIEDSNKTRMKGVINYMISEGYAPRIHYIQGNSWVDVNSIDTLVKAGEM